MRINGILFVSPVGSFFAFFITAIAIFSPLQKIRMIIYL